MVFSELRFTFLLEGRAVAGGLGVHTFSGESGENASRHEESRPQGPSPWFPRATVMGGGSGSSRDCCCQLQNGRVPSFLFK